VPREEINSNTENQREYLTEVLLKKYFKTQKKNENPTGRATIPKRVLIFEL
jgi:hypothetical protein